jgi:hypothetical protein
MQRRDERRQHVLLERVSFDAEDVLENATVMSLAAGVDT